MNNETSKDLRGLGQIAYEAYCDTTGWKSLVSGATLPKWYDVKPEIKRAWEVAGTAVEKEVMGRTAEKEVVGRINP